MNKLEAKIIRQAIRQAAETPKTDLVSGYFLDLVIFWLGVDAYQKMRGPEDPHTEKAVKLIRRHQVELVAGLQQFVVPLTENPGFTRFRAPVTLASRSTPGLEQVLVQAGVLAELFSVLRSRPADLKTVFSEPRATTAAQKTANLASSDSPETILNGLATVPPASRLQTTRAWLKEAAKLANVAPSEIEGTITDAETAKNLGDDLREIEAKLGSLDPMSEDATTLQGQKRDIIDRIEAVVKTSPNPTVAMSAAAVAASQPKVYATKVGKEKGLSPDQERAMMIRGPGIIAAGAGSGKTRVLASKVIYHMDELGVPPQAVMATSFSRKSAAELRKRIEDFGGVFPKGTDTGLGTTHSIAAKLMREYGGGSASRPGMKNYEQSNLVRLAMEQVQMKGATAPPPTPVSLFTHVSSPATADPEPEPEGGGGGGGGLSFTEAMNAAYQNRGELSGFLRGFIEGFFNPDDKWYRMNRGKTRDLTDPFGLTDKQLDILKDVFQYTGVQYHPDSDPVLKGGGRQAAKKRDKNKGLREKYPTFSNPTGQWFNLGMTLTKDGTKETDPIPPGQFKQAITKYKGKCVSPSEAWDKDPTAEAAVYAAYEYLKGPNGEQDFRGKGDFDDVLLDVSKMMLSNPRALKQVQARFKVVLVDEAQDLNRCVSGDTVVQTPEHCKYVRDLVDGDRVLSYENGQVVFNTVQAKVRSSWTRGYKVTTESGRTLVMSPNHKVYATPVTIPEGSLALYLMYRKGMGFRIGASKRLFHSTENGSAGRAQSERADCAWVLEIGDPDEILFKEAAFSLQKGIPTLPFEAASRGCNQERADRIFATFGEHGRTLLEQYDLDFNRPHWTTTSCTVGRFHRFVVNLQAHRNSGEQRGSKVGINWTGDVPEGINLPVYDLKNDRKMVNKLSVSYTEAAEQAAVLAQQLGARINETLDLGGQTLPLVTASALHPGMALPVWEGGVDLRSSDLLPIEQYQELARRLEVDIQHLGGSRNKGKAEIHNYLRQVQKERGLREVLAPMDGASMGLDTIEMVEPIEHDDFWDITVAASANFFGNGILSHNSQHMMFGIIAGYVDPAKAGKIATVDKFSELSKDDGTMIADTYTFIGDDKQCLAESSMISTSYGPMRLGGLQGGSRVLSYRNGSIEEQILRYVVPSAWTWGYRITTASGHVVMSPNHKLWASEPVLTENEVFVYLMFREDMGFRVGTTERDGKNKRGTGYYTGFGGRAFLEKAEKLWVLDKCSNRTAARLQEVSYSLKYGIPTTVFNGRHRGLDQAYIDAVFEKFGRNGLQLLEDKSLAFTLPHWMSQGYTKHHRERHVVHLLAHTPTGTQVTLEWQGGELDDTLAGITPSAKGNVFCLESGDRRRLRRYFKNYREALTFADDLCERTGGVLSKRLSVPEGPLRYITASGLFPGMQVPVLSDEGSLCVEEIISVERVEDKFLDIDVDDASNLFANQILTGNSIYGFRGADPETFIDMSDLVEGGAGFKTEILKTNYRSGERIVQAANRLIAHNSRQIPMTCEANPARADQGGISRIPFEPVEGKDMSAPAQWLATKIEETMELGEAERGYDSFGVGLRSNAEAYIYGLELLKKGIPFRSKVNFFSDPSTKSLLYWLMLADEGVDGNVERINEAVLNARSAPVTMLGPKFVDTLSSMASGNYLQWLQQNWQSVYGSRSRFTDNVKQYLGNLLAVAALKNETLSNEQIIDRLLKMEGFDGSSVEDALMDKIRDDDEAMAELQAASPDGSVHDDDVKDKAFAPIAPLLGLLDARSNLSEAMKLVRTLQNANSKLATVDDPDAPGFKQPAVTLGTMHSWKGLEVENMFVPIVGGRFPRSDATEEDLASERRLGYVALTRGENNVFVMDIPTILMTKKGPVVRKSQFIDEMCLPTSHGKTSNLHVAEDSSPLPYGMSAHDPVLMEAYLRGDDPYEVALNLGRDENRMVAAISQHGAAVVAALRED